MDDCLGVGTMEVGSGPVGDEVCPEIGPAGLDIILTIGARRKLTERGIRWANVPDGRSDFVHHGGQRVQHVSTVMNIQFRPIHEEHRGEDPRGGRNGVSIGEPPTGVVKYRFRDYRKNLVPDGINLGGGPTDAFGNPTYPWSPPDNPVVPAGPTCPIWLPGAARVLVLGGYGNQVTPILDFIPFYGTNMAEIYDPEFDTWEEVAHPPNQADRTDAEAVLLNSGKVLIMAGHAMNSGSSYTSVELFDPTDETFHLVTTPVDANSTFPMIGPVLLSGSTVDGHVMVSRNGFLYRYDPNIGVSGTFIISTVAQREDPNWPSNWNTTGVGNGIQLLNGKVFYFHALDYATLYDPILDSVVELDMSLWPAPGPNGQGLVLGNGNVVFRDGVLRVSDYSWTLHDFTTAPSIPSYNVLQPDPAFLPDDQVLFTRKIGNASEVHPGIYNPHISCSTGVFTDPDPTGSWSTGSDGPGAGKTGMGHDQASVIGLANRTVLWTGGNTYDVSFADPFDGSLSRKATVFDQADNSFVVVEDMKHQRIDHVSTLLPYTTPFPKGHINDPSYIDTFASASANAFALWRFDETVASGALVDIVNGRNINAFGSPDIVTGKIGNARHVTGSDVEGGATKFFERPGDGILGVMLNGAWSLEMWIKPEPIVADYRILFIYNGLSFTLDPADTVMASVHYHGSSQKIGFQSWKNYFTAVEGTSSGSLTVNDWNHVALTRESLGSNLFTNKLYINGRLDSTFPRLAGMDYVITGSNHFIGLGNFTDIAGYGTGSAPFVGDIDDTRLSSGTRAGVEILESYNRGVGIRGPKTKAWKTGPNLLNNQIGPAISRLSTGELVVTGGDDDPRPAYPGVYNADYAVKISPNGLSVTSLPNMISSRSYHSQVTLPDDSVFVVGGSQTQFGSPTVHHAELFVTGTWHETSVVPTLTASSDYYNAGVTLMQDGRVAVVGGNNSPNEVVRTIHHAYNRVTNIWDDIGVPGTLRSSPTLNMLSDGRLLMVGGLSTPGNTSTAVASAEIWQSPGLWTTIPGPDTAVSQHSSMVLNDGKVLVMGGFNSANNQVTESYLYTPNAGTGSWERVGDLPYPMATFASPSNNAVLLDDGRVAVVMGGDLSFPEHGDKVSVYYPALKKWLGWRSIPNRWGEANIGKLSRNRIIHLGGDLDDTYTYLSGSRILEL